MSAKDEFPGLTDEEADAVDKVRARHTMMDLLRRWADDACAKDVHAVTHKVGSRDRCTRCDKDVTERLLMEIF